MDILCKVHFNAQVYFIEGNITKKSFGREPWSSGYGR